MRQFQNVKHFTLKHIFSWLLQFFSSRSDQTFIFLTTLAEKWAKKDYYQREIRHIRRLFLTGHPSLQVARKIMGDIDPHHRRKLVETFIINQLLVGTEKRQYFSSLPDGFYPPGFAVISPSMNCNLSCYGCYSSLHSKQEELSYEQFDSVLRQQKEMGMYFAVISGGEPFIYKHIFDIFKEHSDVAFLVFTNGAALTDKIVARIADLGNILPCISVEGFEEETDHRRGKGHYHKVMDAFSALRQTNLLYGFSATQTRLNSDILTSDQYIDIFIEQGCVLGWYFHYMPVGKSPAMELLPTPEQRNHLRERVAYFRKYKPILLGDFHNDGPVVGGCIAGGRKYLHINSTGDIEPCVFLQYSTHNIKEHSLQDALRSPFFKHIREGQDNNKNLLRPCTIVDCPSISRNAVEKNGANPSHHGADALFTNLKSEIDTYSKNYGKIADEVWANMPQTREELLRQEEEIFARTGKLSEDE
ncbi:radical SAM protein [candidate division CSSED10-310 bacterium]|uniref:Radical SAM protein n=1 Tax=candidate division CSSED10-310 bacterium TaxID=2855610 RepID=A0ABV6YV53_UNCC1